jgi:hypothetical protein
MTATLCLDLPNSYQFFFGRFCGEVYIIRGLVGLNSGKGGSRAHLHTGSAMHKPLASYQHPTPAKSHCCGNPARCAHMCAATLHAQSWPQQPPWAVGPMRSKSMNIANYDMCKDSRQTKCFVDSKTTIKDAYHKPGITRYGTAATYSSQIGPAK